MAGQRRAQHSRGHDRAWQDVVGKETGWNRGSGRAGQNTAVQNMIGPGGQGRAGKSWAGQGKKELG